MVIKLMIITVKAFILLVTIVIYLQFNVALGGSENSVFIQEHFLLLLLELLHFGNNASKIYI